MSEPIPALQPEENLAVLGVLGPFKRPESLPWDGVYPFEAAHAGEGYVVKALARAKVALKVRSQRGPGHHY